jgi:hypothetical protein
VYVLNAPLQAGQSQPKWQERSWVGCYLGCSSQHATSVLLILQPRTGLVSPQFHCIFDENLETLSNLGRFVTLWPTNPKLPAAINNYSDTTIPSGLDAPWFLSDDDDDASTTSPTSTATADATDADDSDFAPTDHLYDADPPIEPATAPPNLDATPFTAPLDGARTRENEGGVVSDLENEGGATCEIEGNAVRNQENEGARTGSHRQRGAPATFQSRSGRTVKISEKVLDSEENFGSINPTYSTKLAMAHFVAFMATMLDDETFNDFHPFAYVASLADKDSMNFAEAMRQTDSDQFVVAMEKEISNHVQREHWKIYSRSEMRRSGYCGRVIMAVWSFKRKRNPFGVITKYKARLCAHGGQTVQGIHYDSSYSPVVSWTTIRLLLTLTLVLGWFTRQIDFVLLLFPKLTRKPIYLWKSLLTLRS